jgi:uncharacterized protein YrrD
MLQQGSALNGFSVEATNGKLGTVSEFLFDDKTWKLRWLVVDTGGWLNDRKILLHPSSIDRADMPARTLLVNLTQDQVEKSPGIATDEPVSRQMEHNLYGYYGVDPLWGGGYYGGNMIAQPMAATGLAGGIMAPQLSGANDKRDPDLRSLKEVTGYDIHASDGRIGHIEAFLFDDATWDIRYLVVDTRNWWFGKHVLISPSSVREILWETHEVSLNLTGYKIKGSPPWDATSLIDRAYELVLGAYYGWPDPVPPIRQAASAAPVKVPAE